MYVIYWILAVVISNRNHKLVDSISFLEINLNHKMTYLILEVVRLLQRNLICLLC